MLGLGIFYPAVASIVVFVAMLVIGKDDKPTIMVKNGLGRHQGPVE